MSADAQSPFNLLAIRQIASRIMLRCEVAAAEGPWEPTAVLFAEADAAVCELQEAGVRVSYGNKLEALTLLLNCLRQMADTAEAEATAFAAIEVAAAGEGVGPTAAPAAATAAVVPPVLTGRASWTYVKTQRFLGWSMKHGLAEVIGHQWESETDDWVAVELLAHHLAIKNWGDFKWDTPDDIASLISRSVKLDPAHFEVDCDGVNLVRYIRREERVGKGKGTGKAKSRRQGKDKGKGKRHSRGNRW